MSPLRWTINVKKQMPTSVLSCCEPGFRYDRVCVSVLISACRFSFYITRLSSVVLFFPLPYFSGCACREDEPGALGPASSAPLYHSIPCSRISFCVATLMSLMRVPFVSGFLTNSFLSNLLLFYTTLFCLASLYTPPLPGSLFRSFRVSSSRAF
jgi:hypothetical protein